MKIANIYWISKLHKYPSKTTFVMAVPEYLVKSLSKAVISIFKLMCKQIETYDSEIHYFSGAK